MNECYVDKFRITLKRERITLKRERERAIIF